MLVVIRMVGREGWPTAKEKRLFEGESEVWFVGSFIFVEFGRMRIILQRDAFAFSTQAFVDCLTLKYCRCLSIADTSWRCFLLA